ncbi:MAG: hypothetical protein Q6J68_04620 [Thermostichales cyanobacterium SZTDM-1c_bins_54]
MALAAYPRSALEDYLAHGPGWWDASDWGRLFLAGPGVTDYLHSQTSQQLRELPVGQSTLTTFLSATAHLLDLVTLLRVDTEAWWLITSPGSRSTLIPWIQRLLQFSRQSRLEDRSDTTQMVRVLGSPPPPTFPAWVIADAGLGCGGLTVWVEQEFAPHLHRWLVGIPKLTEADWQVARVVRGLPAWGAEITPDYNPLEAGLWQAISLQKGCYIGQEVLAKQTTYQRLRQRLWGLVLHQPVPPGSPITIAGHKEGVVTSCVSLADQVVGLGYVRTKTGQAGTAVQVGPTQGLLFQPPYLSFPQWRDGPEADQTRK